MVLKKKRLNYVDVAKGLLIIFVVVGHVLSALKKTYPESAFLAEGLELKNLLWVSYYMPAFFVLTGFCSNFEKPFGTFFVANCKSLKVPAIFFGIIYSLGHCIQHEGGGVDALKVVLMSPLHSGFWFLDALFISKIVYWFVNRLFHNYKMRLIVSFVLLCVATVSWKVMGIEDDFFNILHAIIFVFFISFGRFARITEFDFPQKYVIAIIPYIIVCLTLFINKISIPSITRVINIDYNVLLFVILSLCGSITLISISRMINGNVVLEYIGRNSLVFYMIHLIALSPCLKICQKLLPADAPIAFLTVCISLFAICTIFSILLNKKYLNVLLGKF